MSIKVYTQDGCKYCHHVKAFISANGGTFEERNINHNKDYYKEWEEFNVLGVPVTVVGGTPFVGFTDELKEALVHALGISG